MLSTCCDIDALDIFILKRIAICYYWYTEATTSAISLHFNLQELWDCQQPSYDSFKNHSRQKDLAWTQIPKFILKNFF